MFRRLFGRTKIPPVVEIPKQQFADRQLPESLRQRLATQEGIEEVEFALKLHDDMLKVVGYLSIGATECLIVPGMPTGPFLLISSRNSSAVELFQIMLRVMHEKGMEKYKSDR